MRKFTGLVVDVNAAKTVVSLENIKRAHVLRLVSAWVCAGRMGTQLAQAVTSGTRTSSDTKVASEETLETSQMSLCSHPSQVSFGQVQSDLRNLAPRTHAFFCLF